jgi:hypothetical protein
MTPGRAAALATWRQTIDRLGRDTHTVAWLVLVLCAPDPQPRGAVTTNPEGFITGLMDGTHPRPGHWPPAGAMKSWTMPLRVTAVAQREALMRVAWNRLASLGALTACGVAIPPAVDFSIRRAVAEDARQRGWRPNRRARRAGRRRPERGS